MSTNHELTTLGNNLKLLRERERLTTEEMARVMRISTKAYALLEQGTLPKRVCVNCLLYAADYFNLSPADLFKMQEEKPNPLRRAGAD